MDYRFEIEFGFEKNYRYANFLINGTMKDVEKFEKFEDLKKSEASKNENSENTQEMVEEFIQLLIRNSSNDKKLFGLSKT